MTPRSRAFHLLRIWAALLGKISGGASPSPTQQHSVYLMIGVLLFIIHYSLFSFQSSIFSLSCEWNIMERFREGQAPPLQGTLQRICRGRHLWRPVAGRFICSAFGQHWSERFREEQAPPLRNSTPFIWWSECYYSLFIIQFSIFNFQFIMRMKYNGKVSGGAQWRLTNHRLCLFLERCCMGIVSQITDLDNSSKPLPYKGRCSEIVGECLGAPAAGRWIMNNVG